MAIHMIKCRNVNGAGIGIGVFLADVLVIRISVNF